ncbi:hypothetical protein PR048_023114 [Dryococelus australis]|uniref:Tc1-like transposase DDE domain-containing protein n=1 Tax=Dryococelus australis TaxID=614101 RepID=A0ABQ9GTA1_9NEOP|nr:hypothetical protein PR048_023114 [Dryococelus australis]
MVKTKKLVFLSGLSTDIKKNPQYCKLEVTSDFVEDIILVFGEKKKQTIMKRTVKRLSWFVKILPKLSHNNFIVMDNASYHSVKLEHVPTKSWRKPDIISWLTSTNIE